MIVQLAALPVDDDYRAPLGSIHPLWRERDETEWLERHGGDVRVLISHSMKRVGAEILDRLPRLGLIANFGAGLDNIDLYLAQQRGVAVTHTPDAVTEDVADLAMTLALSSLRRVAAGDRFVRAGSWGLHSFGLGRSASGLKLGLFGYGRIGQAIARRAEAYGMQIGYVARARRDSPHIYFADLSGLATWSDILIVAASGGAETANVIDARILRALGEGGHLVNVARGSLVDERALYEALRTNVIAGAACDVFADEPHVSEDLRSLPNLIATPHIGSATVEARRRMADEVYSNVRAFLDGKPLRDRVV
jgi:hydroxypyruvate reductase